MAIQRLEEIPAICQNKKCSNYKTFEMYDVDDVLTDIRDSEGDKDYFICEWCGKRIYLD